MEKKHLVKRKLKRFCFVAHDTLSGYLLSLSVLSFLSRHQMQKKKDTSKGWHLDTKSERMLSVYAVLTELWHLLSSLHRHLWPVQLFNLKFNTKLNFERGSFDCCCVWKSEEKWARTLCAFKWLLECGRVRACVLLCACPCQCLCKCVCVCVFIRVYLLPCVLQLTVTKASRLACKRDSCADRRICFCRFCLWA